MKLPALTFLASPWLKLAAVAVAVIGIAGAGAYAGYRWELGKYESLVADVAKAHARDLAREAKLKADFYVKLAAATAQSDALQAELDAARSAQNAGLQSAITKEEKTNAPLAACLHTKLPDSVLRQLAR